MRRILFCAVTNFCSPSCPHKSVKLLVSSQKLSKWACPTTPIFLRSINITITPALLTLARRPLLSTLSSGRSRSDPRRRSGSKLIASAVELTRRSKTKKKGRSVAFLKGSRALYRGPKGIEKVTVVGVHHDSKLEPYYTIRFRDGKEKQMDGKCLTPIEEKKEAAYVAGAASTSGGKEKKPQCAGSDPDPTDQCSTSSSDDDDDGDDEGGEDQEEESYQDDRFHQGQHAYYRSPSGEGVSKIKSNMLEGKWSMSL